MQFHDACGSVLSLKVLLILLSSVYSAYNKLTDQTVLQAVA